MTPASAVIVRKRMMGSSLRFSFCATMFFPIRKTTASARPAPTPSNVLDVRPPKSVPAPPTIATSFPSKLFSITLPRRVHDLVVTAGKEILYALRQIFAVLFPAGEHLIGPFAIILMKDFGIFDALGYVGR